MRLIYRGTIQEVDGRLWDLLLGPKPPDQFRFNGCGAGPAILAKAVPDWFLDVPLFLACSLHDHHYSEARPLGGTWSSRQLADWLLGANTFLLLRAHRVSRVTSWLLSRLFRGRVRVWARKAFSWAPGEKPEGWWQRIRDAWGVFEVKDPLTRRAAFRYQLEFDARLESLSGGLRGGVREASPGKPDTD